MGRVLTGHLLERNADITWLEPRPLDTPPGVKLHIGSQPGDYQWPKGSFTDLIIAANASNREPFPKKGIPYFQANISTPFYLLQWAIDAGISHVVMFSSGSVYFVERLAEAGANFNGLPTFNESVKYAEELLLRHFALYTYLHIVRLFRPYGPGKSTSLVNSAVRRLIDGKPVKLKSPDGPLIQPIFLEDAAKAVAHLLTVNESNIIDLAGRERVSLGKIVRDFAGMANLIPDFFIQPEKAIHDREIKESGVKEIDCLITTPLKQGLKVFLKPGEKNESSWNQ